MNDVITKIEIDSFRSIRREAIETGNINIFSGLNDVGKSNVLKAINLFFNGQTGFGSGFNFNEDYSKVSLAAAQRSNKKKQQVKIKVHFKIPQSFKSLQGESVWLERIFDRSGRLTEIYSHEDYKKRASITRLVNSIQYYYIPALKGSDVLKYIIGEVGKRQLVSNDDIKILNDKVNENIKDLTNILNESAIDSETRFELPVLVSDFWEKLNIHTKYDELSTLDEKIKPSIKGKKDILRKEFFQVPLLLRGDGIKSKFIPPLLLWIQRHEPKRIYIWGVDEPENSLEFKKAQELANLYFSKYSISSQLFLTSHSLAFIFSDNKDTNIFRCFKGELGQTKFSRLDDLFADVHKLDLAEEIGALEIQKEMYNEWRGKDRLIEELSGEIQKHTKPLIITEGYNVEHIKKALSILDSSLLSKIDFLEGAESKTGKDQLKTIFHIFSRMNYGKKILFVWDCDSYNDIGSLQESKTALKFCFKNNEKNNKVTVGIENLYPKSLFSKACYFTKKEVDKCGAKKCIQQINKNQVLKLIQASNEPKLFKNYEPLIVKILELLKK